MRISDWSSDVCSSDLTSDSLGRAVITLTFEQGTDADTAQVQVQNKLQLATARLPREVQQSGLIVAKATNSILLAAAIYSEDRSEEHTSELQSLMRISYAVFCLKKKK